MATAANPLVRTDVSDGVGVITLDDPPTNSLSPAMIEALGRAILTTQENEHVHVLLIAGTGEEFFSAGADLDLVGDSSPDDLERFFRRAGETLRMLEETPLLVIAALGGHAIGGGLELALACDLRIGWHRSGKASPAPCLGFPEVRRGVVPGMGGTWRLTRELGKSRALHWLATGDHHSFADGERLGLIHRLIETDNGQQFHTAAIDYAREFCPPTRASRAVGLIKRGCHTMLEVSQKTGIEVEQEILRTLLESEDAKEGMAAFREKRKPRFRGG